MVEEKADHKRVVVRARAKDHLRKLQKLGSHLAIPIHEDEGTDYAYRVYMIKEQWKESLAQAGGRYRLLQFQGLLERGAVS